MQRARSQEDKEIKKQEIKDKSIILFLDNPRELPSVSQIAQSCGLTKGALYRYFNTKEEIFLDILQDEYISWFRLNEKIINEEREFITILDKIFEPIFKNELMLRLSIIAPQIIEINSSLERTVAFKVFLGESLDMLTNLVSKKFNISKEILLKNLMESFTIFIGAYQMSLLPHNELRKRVPYAFLFPDFERHTKSLLKKVWQF